MESKKRSLSQRIGESGEAYIKYWATKNSFSASKFENDYGYDFTFMGFNKIKEHEIVNGINFLAQCKTTESDGSKYVKIDRSDAGLYLSSSTPFCILAVELNTETVAFRFGDKELVDKLVGFINSANDTLCLSIKSEFTVGPNFSAESKKYAHHNYYSRLKTYIAQKLLEAKAPGIKLSVFNDEGGTDLFVESEWITNVLNPKTIFNHDKKSEIFINSEVAQIFSDYYPGFRSLLIAGSVGLDSKISGSVSGSVAPSISYPHDSNICFRTKSGFTFVAAPCEEIEGQHVHKVSFVVEDAILPIIYCKEDLNAFTDILVNDELFINDHSFCKVSEFESLQCFFQSFCDVNILNEAGIHECAKVHASDLKDDHLYITVSLIARLMEHKNIVKDFVIHGNEAFDRSKATGVLPIIFQIKSQKYVAKATASFDLFTYDGYIVGLGGVEIKNIKIEAFKYESRNIDLPELWLHTDFPVVPLGIAGSKIKTTSVGELPYEIDID